MVSTCEYITIGGLLYEVPFVSKCYQKIKNKVFKFSMQVFIIYPTVYPGYVLNDLGIYYITWVFTK